MPVLQGKKRNSMKNPIATNVITEIKWANYLKDINYQNTKTEPDNLNNLKPKKETESIIT
jgi:hypothetical protein